MVSMNNMRCYSKSEIWLEQEMKLLWDGTRQGERPLSLGLLLGFWSQPDRMAKLLEAEFSDDWIGVLYQRVSYLIENKTLLGSEDDKIHQARVILITAVLLQQKEAADITDLLPHREPSHKNLQREYPVFLRGWIACRDKSTMQSYVQSSGFDLDEKDPSIDVIVVNSSDDTRDEMHTYPDTTLREFIEFYKSMKEVSKDSFFRVKYMGKTIFLSSSGNKTLTELGVDHRSYIQVIEVKPQPISAPPKKEKKKASTKCKKGARKKGGKKSKKKQPINCNYETKDHKVEHSKRLSLVFEEVENTFKEMRQRLSDLSLKKSLPKDRSVHKKKDTPCTNTLTGNGACGKKPGTTIFQIIAGDTNCLYQSSKKTNHNLRILSLDLHGLTEEEALERLTASLPSWVETAMTGEYPFVIGVDIIPGGGAQVLSEVVEKWIKRNPNVANRPKNF